MTGAARTSRSPIASLAFVLWISAALAGCGGGGDDSSSSAAATSPSTGNTSQSPAPSQSQSPTPSQPQPQAPAPGPSPFDPVPSEPEPQPDPVPAPAPAPVLGNQAPEIKGAPSTSATVNVKYSFSPTATDADNDTLGFSIKNKPEWASFNTATGALSGTPTQAKTHANIVITVNDGHTEVSLPAFSIIVSEPEVPGAVTLTWNPPTENEDGSPLENLAGYAIVYGPSSTQLHETLTLNQPGLHRYVFDDLPAGTYYFAVKAFTSTGTYSGLSNIVSKVVQ